MRSWSKMLKDLTWRPHDRKVRKSPLLPIQQDWNEPLSGQRVKEELSKSSDVVFRDFIIQGKEPIPCLLGAVDGLIDKNLMDHFVLKPLMIDLIDHPVLKELTLNNVLNKIVDHLFPGIEVKVVSEMGEAIDAILSGDAVLFFGELPKALVFGAKGWKDRGVSEPEAESVVRGPREGFSETLRTNTALIRRKIKHPALRILSLKIGDMSKTDIVVVYLEGIAKPDIVSEVLRRLSRIKIDGVLESAYLEEMIEDVPYTPFPQIAHTERPDVFASRLLEGKVGILVDGTPFALMVPAVFVGFLHVSEDYYEKAMIVILIRFIRYIGIFVALFAPSIYIAVTTFHQEILPTQLALSIAASREGVPVPALLEALFMTLMLEIVQEAGLRLPRPIGQTIGIVGAIVIGDAAVKASLVSPIMVIIISITAISTYSIPSYDLAIAFRLLRFPLMILAGTLGFFGLSFGLYAGLIHLLSIRSFGEPYFSPVAPLRIRAFLQDTFVRAPWWALKRRPRLVDIDKPKSGGKT